MKDVLIPIAVVVCIFAAITVVTVAYLSLQGRRAEARANEAYRELAEGAAEERRALRAELDELRTTLDEVRHLLRSVDET